MSRRLRESGVDWLGAVPSGWDTVPARALFGERKAKSAPSDVHLTPSQKYGVLPQETYMQITGSKVVLNLTGAENMRHVEAGDYVSHLRSFQGGLEYAEIPGKVSAAYTVLKPKIALSSRFFKYLFKSDLYIQALQTTTDQLRDGQSIRYRQLSQIPLPQPPLAEQQAIADYLDRETAQIDAFIAKNEELITLLTERRLAAITSAVTEAAGTEHAVALRHLASVLDCKHVTATPAEGDDSYAVASVREVADRWVDVSKARRTTAESFKNLGEGGRTLRAWDLLVCRNASVGKISIVPPGIEPTVMGQDVSLIRIPGANPGVVRFLHYALTSAVGVDGIEQASIGSTFKRINVDDIKSLRVPNVGLTAARRVADQLDDMTSRVDDAIATAKRSVVLARERRASLISAAVTGKIDVGVPT